jgi:hypothetical protein
MRYATLLFSRHREWFVTIGEGAEIQFLRGPSSLELIEHHKKLLDPKPLAVFWEMNKVIWSWWGGEFITKDDRTVTRVPYPDRDASIPTQFAMEELGRLSEEGWRLVHVSEDRGLFSGEATTSEAYVVRLRYLLETPH